MGTYIFLGGLEEKNANFKLSYILNVEEPFKVKLWINNSQNRLLNPMLIVMFLFIYYSIQILSDFYTNVQEFEY